MSVCVTCGNYYRLTPFHKDVSNCEDCFYLIPSDIDEESAYEIQQILHPGSKTEPIRYDE